MIFIKEFEVFATVVILSTIVGFLLIINNGGRIAVSLFFILTLVFVFFVTWNACGYTFFPTPTSSFILLAVLHVFLGSFIFYWEGKKGSQLAMLVIAGSLIAFCIGALLANAVRNFRPRLEVVNYLHRPLTGVRDSRKLLHCIVALSLLSIAGSLFYYQGIPPIIEAMKRLLAGDDLGNIQHFVSLARQDITKGHLFLGLPYRGQGYLRLLWMLVLPYLVLCSILYSRIARKSSWRWVRFLLIPISFLFLIGTGERARLVWTLAVFLFAGFYIKGRWLKTGLMRWGVIALLSYFILTALLGRSGTQVGIGTLAGNLWERVLRSEAYNTVDVFELIPQYKPYYSGEIIWTGLLGLLPGPSSRTSFSYQLAQFQGRSPESLTYASSSFFSNTYADFGVFGTILSCFCIGFLLQLVTIKLVRTPAKTPLSVTLFAFLAGYLSSTLISGTLVSPIGSIVPILALYYVLQRASGVSGKKRFPQTSQR